MESIPRGAAPASVRHWNEAAVLRALNVAGPLRISALREATGITPGPLGQVLRGLEEKGWVSSSRADVRGPGRPAQIFELRPPRGWLLGIEIGRTAMRAVRTEANGGVEASAELAVTDELCLDGFTAQLLDLIASVLPENGYDDVWAGAIAIDAEFDARGTVLDSSALPCLVGTRPVDRLDDRIPVPFDAIARMPAILQSELGHRRVFDAEYCMTVELGERIEVGLFRDGNALRVSQQVSGHFPRLEAEQLEALAAAGREGDEAACERIRELVVAYGDSVAMAAALMSPRRIVLSGPLAEIPDVVLPVLREELQARLREVPELSASALDGLGTAVGAALHAREWVIRTLLRPSQGTVEMSRESFLSHVVLPSHMGTPPRLRTRLEPGISVGILGRPLPADESPSTPSVP